MFILDIVRQMNDLDKKGAGRIVQFLKDQGLPYNEELILNYSTTGYVSQTESANVYTPSVYFTISKDKYRPWRKEGHPNICVIVYCNGEIEVSRDQSYEDGTFCDKIFLNVDDAIEFLKEELKRCGYDD